jgi:hypothetical protein
LSPLLEIKIVTVRHGIEKELAMAAVVVVGTDLLRFLQTLRTLQKESQVHLCLSVHHGRMA